MKNLPGIASTNILDVLCLGIILEQFAYFKDKTYFRIVGSKMFSKADWNWKFHKTKITPNVLLYVDAIFRRMNSSYSLTYSKLYHIPCFVFTELWYSKVLFESHWVRFKGNSCKEKRWIAYISFEVKRQLYEKIGHTRLGKIMNYQLFDKTNNCIITTNLWDKPPENQISNQLYQFG